MNTKSKYNSEEYLHKQYNKLYVLEYLSSNDDRNFYREPAYICRCDCGVTTIHRVKYVVNGVVKSCDNCTKLAKTKSKYEDTELMNKKYDRLSIVEFIATTDSRNTQKAPAYLCKCDCGNIVIKKASHVIKGTVKSCGKCHEGRSKYADESYIGKKFGHLEVIDIGHDDIQNTFICNCDCGRSNNIEYSASMIVNGYKKQCNICAKEISTSTLETKHYDESLLDSLIGKTFGKLTITKIINEDFNDRTNSTVAICDCDCGTKDKKVLLSAILRDNGTRACGNCRVAPNAKYDLPSFIGTKYNYLTVEDIIKKGGKTYWKCSCSLCGHGTVTTVARHVVSGNTKSCGCMQSYGETVIEKALQSRNIKYKKQVTFKGLTGVRGGPLRFDFGIYGNNDKLLGLIEYDGSQHFNDFNENYYITEYEIANDINLVKENDKIKNKFCEDNNIQLVRINGYITEGIFFEKMRQACSKE
jgi:hypothetical protein